MNIVIFTWNFPPLSDAEAYCTARFASALAQFGHNVKIVTMRYTNTMRAAIYDVLVDANLDIVRVQQTIPPRRDLVTQLYYKTAEWNSGDFGASISVLSDVLKKTENPILVSRANPSSSHVVAWHCRKYAYKWIAHFSDPYPWFSGNRSIGGIYRKLVGRHWGKRILRDCSAVSLTCQTVCRFFSSQYGKLFDEKKHFVVTHIGEPKFDTAASLPIKPCMTDVITHSGTLTFARGAREIVSAISLLNQSAHCCEFYQVGGVGAEMREFMSKNSHVKVYDQLNEEEAFFMVEHSKACIISDLDVGLGYSPFLPSKFAYQIFTNTPIVLYTYLDSEMARYAKLYPNAGLFIARIGDVRSLCDALGEALSCDHKLIDREKIRQHFSRHEIAKEFSRQLEDII